MLNPELKTSTDRRTIKVDRLRQGNLAENVEWDRFVYSSPHGSPYHLTAWREVVEIAFSHRPHYLMARAGGRVVGVLPLFELYGPLVGHVLLSVPYGVYGGIVTSSETARATLLDAAHSLGMQLGARYIEFRHTQETALDLPTKSLYMTFVRPMASDPSANFEAIPRKQRRMVRQGMKHGLEGRRGWEHLTSFYEVFADSRRRLGSPVYPMRLFEALRYRFSKEAQLLTVWHKGRVIAGVMSLYFQDRVMPHYSGALQEALALAGNDFMYWELMRESCLAGYRIFDFGRSRQGSGPYNFKRHWGFEPKPLAYQYVMVSGRKLPNISPANPRFSPFIKVWKHLPLSVTKRIGPALTRWLPT
jgi:FemAB-related protein (PEP-CTERM system-associated)